MSFIKADNGRNVRQSKTYLEKISILMQVQLKDIIKPRKSNSLPRPIKIRGRGRSNSDYAGLRYFR